jgi:flagellar biogenesis protein FliO
VTDGTHQGEFEVTRFDNKLSRLALVMALALALTTTAMAATTAAPAADDLIAAPAADMPDMGSALRHLMLVMGLLMAALIGGMVLFQKYMRKRAKKNNETRALRVVDKLPLGQRKFIYLINACGRHVVLGVAEKEINVLMEVSAPSEECAPSDFGQLMQSIDMLPVAAGARSGQEE